MDEPLIYVRAIHFAATIAVSGGAFFMVFVAGPAFAKAGQGAPLGATVARWLARIAWVGLVLAVLSGIGWLIMLAQTMSGRLLDEMFSDGTLWMVLSQTGFGRDWLVRLVIACLLAAALAWLFSAREIVPTWLKAVVIVLAAALVGSLGWAGHGVGGVGAEAVVHPAADCLHLIAAAAWLGMLVPLAIVLAAVGNGAESLDIARTIVVRFSNCSVGSVGVLLATGIINTSYLAGSVPALTQTDYGRLLLIKVALFLVMVTLAAINRFHFTPRLAEQTHNACAGAAADALRHLRRNAMIEIVIGAVIIAIVAVLGVTPPGHLEQMTLPHHH